MLQLQASKRAAFAHTRAVMLAENALAGVASLEAGRACAIQCVGKR